MNGFTDDQIIEIRKGGASWDNKINILAATTNSSQQRTNRSRNPEAFIQQVTLKKI
jgi:hypothetical protein